MTETSIVLIPATLCIGEFWFTNSDEMNPHT
jgi:hypothetical protein